jgi:hypothetical protein
MPNHRLLVLTTTLPFALLLGRNAIAAEPPTLTKSSQETQATPVEPLAPTARDWGAEVNILWPFFPGGISEFRLLVPLWGEAESLRTDAVIGLYSDFASRVVRDHKDGKVRNLSAKLGLRQFFWQGIHAEASVNLGWRNEVERPDGESYHAFQARLWLYAGYQHDRSDRFASEERPFVMGGDLNLGVHF